jgi:hypothetical protein
MASNFHQPPKKRSRSEGAASGGASGGKGSKPPREKRGVAADKTPSIGRAAARSGAVKGVRAKGGNTKGSRSVKPPETTGEVRTARPSRAAGSTTGSGKTAGSTTGSGRTAGKTAGGGKVAGTGRTAAPGRTASQAKGPRPGKSANAATAAANPGSYLNNCRKRALSVHTRRELGQQPRDVLVQLAIAHPVRTMRLGAVRQLTAGDSPRDVAALRLVERSIEAGPEVRAAASRGADIVQHRVDDL